MIADVSWMTRAECAQPHHDPEWFFPEGKGRKAPKHVVAICNELCEVRTHCLNYALHNPVEGVWGGTSENARAEMRRKLGIRLPSGWQARTA